MNVEDVASVEATTSKEPSGGSDDSTEPALNSSLSLRLVVIAAKTMCIAEYNALSPAKSRANAI